MRFHKTLLRLIIAAIFTVVASVAFSQNVYKTPSGQKYHLGSCRMVVNVSKKLLSQEDISSHGLHPCKICKPPYQAHLTSGTPSQNKSVGESSTVQCKGITKQGSRCKHMTRIANGYCFQHTDQIENRTASTNLYNSGSPTPTCGAPTLSGSSCKRKVKGGGFCYQHK